MKIKQKIKKLIHFAGIAHLLLDVSNSKINYNAKYVVNLVSVRCFELTFLQTKLQFVVVFHELNKHMNKHQNKNFLSIRSADR